MFTKPARILVIDDEEVIRRVLVAWLHRWGHDAIEAASAPAGLILMQEKPADILIVDLFMPAYTGLWMIERVRQRWPFTSIILASGADETTVQNATQQYGAINFVPKPFGRETIHQAVARAMESRAPSPTPDPSRG